MNKHYIRLDEKTNIIKAFSDAFEQPLQADIFIHDGERHFEMNGEINPPLTTFDGIFLYKWINNEIIAKTEQQIESERSKIVIPPTIQEQLDAQAKAISALMGV